MPIVFFFVYVFTMSYLLRHKGLTAAKVNEAVGTSTTAFAPLTKSVTTGIFPKNGVRR